MSLCNRNAAGWLPAAALQLEELAATAGLAV